jgi:hypothetical protein
MEGAPGCISICRDCADICSVASKFMSRNSEHVEKVCVICNDICNSCASECEKYHDIEGCTQSVEACRKCSSGYMVAVA